MVLGVEWLRVWFSGFLFGMGLDVISAGDVRSGKVGEARDWKEPCGPGSSIVVSIGDPRSMSGVGESDIGEKVVEISWDNIYLMNEKLIFSRTKFHSRLSNREWEILILKSVKNHLVINFCMDDKAPVGDRISRDAPRAAKWIWSRKNRTRRSYSRIHRNLLLMSWNFSRFFLFRIF